jgi:hypothetical protein
MLGQVQPVTVTTSDLDEARAVLGRHFYSNFVDVLSPAAAGRQVSTLRRLAR